MHRHLLTALAVVIVSLAGCVPANIVAPDAGTASPAAVALTTASLTPAATPEPTEAETAAPGLRPAAPTAPEPLATASPEPNEAFVTPAATEMSVPATNGSPALMLTSTTAPAPTVAVASPAGSGSYVDDRSTAAVVIESYVNAIDGRQYARAYSYWRTPGSSASGLPPFTQFAQGFADTASVRLTLGTITGDVGAGQLYYSVPAALVAKTTNGGTQTFVGCYVLHLARPELQAVPPFHPLAIESATMQQVANGADLARLLARACEAQAGGAAPVPTPAASSPSDISEANYVDNRSGPVEVLDSLFNAINRQEYARAYAYWSAAGASTGLPPFAQFQQGYTDTRSVRLATGTVTSGVGAGQLYYRVPVTLVAQNANGATQTFVGCYTLHLARPELQTEPPYHPLEIESAKVRALPAGADAAASMGQSCE